MSKTITTYITEEPDVRIIMSTRSSISSKRSSTRNSGGSPGVLSSAYLVKSSIDSNRMDKYIVSGKIFTTLDKNGKL